MHRNPLLELPRQLMVVPTIFALCVLLPLHLCDAATAVSKVKVIFLYATPISDLAWTFNMNLARLNAFENITSRYPNADVVFDYLESFPSLPNRTSTLESLVAAEYDIIYSGSVTNYVGIDIASFAKRYPQVLWVHFAASGIFFGEVIPNLIYHALDAWGFWFVAGAAAGAQLDPGAQACMLYPYESLNMGVNSFYQGMQFAATGGSLSVVRIGAYYDPEKERESARELVRRGCSIIVRWSDTREPDLFVASLGNSTFSIGYATDAASSVGDSVLTSVYFQLTAFDVRLAESILLQTPPPSSRILRLEAGPDSAIKIAPISARGKPTVRLVTEAAKAYVIANRSVLFCRQYFFLNGSAYPNPCVTDPDLVGTTLQLLPAVTLLQDFIAPSMCTAGSFVKYRSSDLKFFCIPCPLNTYSLQPGSRTCAPCPPGQQADFGSTVCHQKSDVPFWVWIIIAIVGALMVLVGAIGVRLLLRPPPPLKVPAPQGPEVTLVIIGVDCKHTARWRHHILTVCDLTTEIVGRCAAEKRLYVVSSVGEVHLLAAERTEQAYELIAAVLDQAAAAKWPVDVSLRSTIHVGWPQVMQKRADDAYRTRYVGADLDVVREMFKHSSEGGVWCSATTLAHAPPRNAAFGEERTVLLLSGRSEAMVELKALEVGPQHAVKSFAGFVKVSGEVDVDTPSEFDSKSRDGDTRDAEDLAFATLSIISADEFVAAHEFATEVLRLFMGVLPFSDAVSVLTSACLRLRIRPPRIPSELPRRELGLKLLKAPIASVSLQLLRQLEEMELVTLMERWNAAAQSREQLSLYRHQQSTTGTGSAENGTGGAKSAQQPAQSTVEPMREQPATNPLAPTL